MSVEHKVAEILNRPYSRELVPNGDGTWFAKVAEFPGCMTEGDTQQEALENLEDAMTGWVTIHVEDGDPIPEPMSNDAFSGKFLVRVPKSLHRDVAKRAEVEGVSLNQYVVAQLARAVGLSKEPSLAFRLGQIGARTVGRLGKKAGIEDEVYVIKSGEESGLIMDFGPDTACSKVGAQKTGDAMKIIVAADEDAHRIGTK